MFSIRNRSIYFIFSFGCLIIQKETISLPVHEKDTHRQWEEDDLSDDEDAKKRREARYKRARAEEVVRRKDLYELWDHIDDEIESLEVITLVIWYYYYCSTHLNMKFVRVTISFSRQPFNRWRSLHLL